MVHNAEPTLSVQIGHVEVGAFLFSPGSIMQRIRTFNR